MGKRPCSSGMRSETLATWKAPAAMKRTWSVRTGPYLVVTCGALDDGQEVALHAARARRRGRTRESREAILSISSMKTIPWFWARSSASRTTRSMSTMRAASSSESSSTASFTGSLRLRFFPPPKIDPSPPGPMFLNISWSPWVISSIPGPAIMGTWGAELGDLDLHGLVVEGAGPQPGPRPCRRIARPDPAPRAPGPRPPRGPGTRSFSISSSFTSFTAASTRSRIIESTSRPT